MSNYWTPELYVKYCNGSFAPVPILGDADDTNGGMTIYYLQRPGKPNERLQAFPEGFRMIAGDPFKRSFAGDVPSQAITFNCLGAKQPETHNLPNYRCPGGLRAQVFFPACWNGHDLDSKDHKSHMAYPPGFSTGSDACPPGFPVHFISLFYEVIYDTTRFLDQWVDDKQPFVFANGDATGYGFHGDFFNGWDTAVLQRAIDTCNGDGLLSDCHAVTTFSMEESQKCKLPSLVAESVSGVLDKLPGCNPVTYGPERAVPCADTAVLRTGPFSYVDLRQSKGWEYIGCGTDTVADRAFTGASTSSDSMTVESCIDFCSARGFAYAGLEYARECFCAAQLNPKYAPSDGVVWSCTKPCAGNNLEMCGNGGAMSIYHRCSAGSCKNNDVGEKKMARRDTIATAMSIVPRSAATFIA